MGLWKVHRVKTRRRYQPGRSTTWGICEFQTISTSQSIFFSATCTRTLSCNVLRNDETPKKEREHLTNGRASSAVTQCLNIELKMEQYQGPHVRAINIHRPPTGGKSWLRPAPRRNLVFHKKQVSKMWRRRAAPTFKLDLRFRKKAIIIIKVSDILVVS